MKIRKSIFICILLCFLFSFSGFAREILDDSLYAPSARTFAIGGRHAALATDLTTLFNNPAGFNQAEQEMSVAELTLRIGGPVFDIANVVVEGVDGGMEELMTSPDIQNLLKGLYTKFNLLGPISFGYIGGGLGFGFFNISDIELVNSSPLTITSRVSEELMLCGGYSFRIPLPQKSMSTLDLGLLLKGSLKGSAVLEKSFLEFPTLISNLDVDTLWGEPFLFTGAIGFDAGILYSYKDWFSAGIACRDIFSPALISHYSSLGSFIENTETPAKSNALIPFDLSMGAVFAPHLGNFERYITELLVMIDYSDVLDFVTHGESARNPLLHIGFGTELTLLEILAVRLGFAEGLFSAGLGIDLTFFTLNAAMFGTEYSTEPGLNPVYNVMIGLEFRL